MEKSSVLKKVVDTFSSPSTPVLGCELPETPGLKCYLKERSLPQHGSSFSGPFKKKTVPSNNHGDPAIPLGYRGRGYAKDLKPQQLPSITASRPAIGMLIQSGLLAIS
jgi:hypothetical protein